MKTRYLTKSRFKLAYDCPSKLYFEGHPEYKNSKQEDEFLKALAEGGFQVGALAQVMHPSGIEIAARNPDKAVEETAPHLKKKSYTLFEPALKHNDFLVRVDILEKKNGKIHLKEVKSSSWAEDDTFWLKRGRPGIVAGWLPYLLDVAFQTYVARQALPGEEIVPFLVLVDKSKNVSVDGLHQKFRITSEGGRSRVMVAPGLTPKDIGTNILIEVDASEAVEFLLRQGQGEGTIPELAERFAKILRDGKLFPPQLKKQCRNCEYRVDEADLKEREKSGFLECMRAAIGPKFSPEKPLVLDLWYDLKLQDRIDEGNVYLHELDLEDFSEEAPSSGPLDREERQFLQVQSAQSKKASPWVDTPSLKAEMKKWIYPYHFIDFETCMVAIPFFKGQHPYQQIAFQFSHHTMNAKGEVKHENEFLMPDRGKYPNLEFLRALKTALSKDKGTIFRYSNHENTVLNQIREQILGMQVRARDADGLVSFIESITTRTIDKKNKQIGERTMVDLWDLYKKFHFLPATQGSNSLKFVLPATIGESAFLKLKYSKPIYGEEITSKNYRKQAWIRLDETGQPRDPYKLLGPMLADVPQDQLQQYVDEEGIRNGGAAMMAWAKLQFTETSKEEEKRIRSELLRYCELDTLAMVMLVEHWRELCKI